MTACCARRASRRTAASRPRSATAFPDLAAQQPEVVAQHHEAGGEIDDAVDYWTLAGDRAAGRGAYREAIQAFEHGLRLVEDLPRRARARCASWRRSPRSAPPCSAMQGYAAPAVEEAFIRAQRLCEALGADVPARVLHGIWGVPIMRSDHDRAARLLPAFARLVQHRPIPWISSPATPRRRSRVLSRRHRRARDGFERATAWYRTKSYEAFLADYGYDGGLYAYAYLMWCESMLGHPRRALALRDEMCALADAHTTPYGQAIAHGRSSPTSPTSMGDAQARVRR